MRLSTMGVSMTKILLVEDDKSLREIYGVRLLAEGYQIASAGDGEEALAMAVKEHPDLIIADVMMPKISGFDMLDILRSTPETKDLKVIVMTALSSEDQRARGEALGANRYLVKSQVGIEDVVRTVHDVLGDSPIAVAPTKQAFGAPAASVTTMTPKPTNPSPIVSSQPQPTVPNTAPTPVMAAIPSIEPIPNPIKIPVSTPLSAPSIAPPSVQIPTILQSPISPMSTQIPVSTPITQPVEPVTPVPTPVVNPVMPSQLPQPTAPFSTPAVAPSATAPDIATLISQELNGASTTPQMPVQSTPPKI